MQILLFLKCTIAILRYGGPDENEVTEKFNVDWGTYLVTNKSIIYTVIDGRGSGMKGNDMLFSVYRNLGTVEVLDQINVTRFVIESNFLKIHVVLINGNICSALIDFFFLLWKALAIDLEFLTCVGNFYLFSGNFRRNILSLIKVIPLFGDGVMVGTRLV